MKHLAGLSTAVAMLMGTVLVGSMLMVYAPPAVAAPRLGSLVPVGSAAAVPRSAQYVGSLAGMHQIRMDIVLRPRNPAALASFVKAVSTPGSPSYHHFLAKGQFGKVFGPTSSSITEVRNTLTDIGLPPGKVSSNRLVIPVTTTVARAERSLHTRVSSYRMASGRLAFADTIAPALPSGISSYVQSIVGLDTLIRPKPSQPAPSSPAAQAAPAAQARHRLAAYQLLASRLAASSALAAQAGQATLRAAQPTPQAGSTPAACSGASSTASAYSAYTASQIASAYGLTSSYSTGYLGAGETIALYELAPFSSSDISAYQSCYGTSATVNPVTVDGGAPTGTGGSIEDTLDIEDAIGLAPKATIDVYEAPNNSTGPLDNYNQIAANDSAQVVSSSWSLCEPLAGKSYAQSEETMFEQMAAQGQSMLAATGDTGSAGCYPNPPAGFSAVSCASTALCWAGDTAGYVTMWNGTAWNTSLQALPGMSTNGVGYISCPSSGFCMATGSDGSHYDTWSPSGGWNASAAATPLSGNYGSALSCTSSASCWLVDTNGNGTQWTGSSWSAKVVMDSSIGSATSSATVAIPLISCPTASFCLVVYAILTSSNTSQDTSVTWNGASWSTASTAISDSNGIMALSCAPGSSSPCWAVDSGGSAMEWTSSGWTSSPVVVDSGRFLSAVSCAAANLCFALGGNNNLYATEWNGTSWGSPQATGVSLQAGAQLSSGASCPASSAPDLCMSVLTTGGALSWNGSSWGNLQQVDGITSLAVNDPASDPYVTGVGGTDMTSPTSPPTETTWNERLNSGGGGGGGISSFWPMPSWQSGSAVNGVASSYSSGSPCGASNGSYCREVPDVSASADPAHAYVIYYQGNWTAIGGTSAATPTWASLIALADEQCGATTGSTGKVSGGLGFLNPALYSIDASTPSAFNNIRQGNNDYTGTSKGDYPAASGSQTYSMAAGLGSPNGAVLTGALCKSGTSSPPPTVTSVSPASGYSSGGTSVTITGSNFASGAVVLFGSVTATATTVDSSASIVAVTPPEQPGAVTVSVDVNGSSSTTTGSSANAFTFLAGNHYVPLSPTRICDTRPNNPSGLSGTTLSQCEGKTLGPGSTLTISVGGLGSVPISATGAVLNVTAIGSTKSTYLTVYPASDGTRPTASSLNARTGTTVANLVNVALPTSGSSAGMISIYNLAGEVNVTVDVEGYMSASNTSRSSLYHPLANPSRLVDTRCSIPSYKSANSSYCNTIPSPNNSLKGFQAGEIQTIQLSGLDGLPTSGLAAVVLNVAATYTPAGGYFTVYPAGTARPTASNLNWKKGRAVANRVIVSVGANGTVELYASGAAQAIVDVSGYFVGGSSGNYIVPVSPVRICDTRPGNPSGLSGLQAQCTGDTLVPESQIVVKVDGAGGLPSSNISAVMINLTATGADSSGYLSVNPASRPPATSDVNWTGPELVAVPNMVVATVSSTGYITIYNGSGQSNVNVIVDVTGYMVG
ncbi:MAG: protease pro-enzyme activation domain-containing protein [Acidimicrobiales bacterium]